MGKRFADTNLNREPWFRKLKPKLKCAVRFLFDECNAAGMWVIDMETMSYFIGEEIELSELLSTANIGKEDRFEMFGDDKIFIPGFIPFQYGTLSDLSPAHKPIFSLLKKYNLLDRVLDRVSNTLQEKEEDKDMDMVKEDRGAGGRAKPPLKKAAEGQRQASLKSDYKTMQDEMTGQEDKIVFGRVKDFIESEKPTFAEPYVDVWNIFAPWYNLESVREITDDRRDKLRIRAREPGFDFMKALAVIRQRKDYQGENKSGWKITFNYLIASQKNYTEVLEKHQEN